MRAAIEKRRLTWPVCRLFVRKRAVVDKVTVFVEHPLSKKMELVCQMVEKSPLHTCTIPIPTLFESISFFLLIAGQEELF